MSKFRPKYLIESKTLLSHKEAHSSSVNCIKFIPGTNDFNIITGSSDDTIRVWDLNGKELYVLSGHFGPIIDLDFIEKDKSLLLASASEDRTVKVWNFETKEIISNFIEAEKSIKTVHFAGTNLISGSKDKHLRIYDIESEKLLYDLDIGSVTAVAIHPLNDICIAGTTSNNIFIINYSSGEIIRKFNAHELPVQGLDFSTNGKLLISSSLDQHVKIYDVSNDYKELIGFKAHSASVSRVKFIPNQDSFSSCSFDRSVNVFTPGNVKPTKKMRGPKLAVTDMAWSLDGNTIAFSSADGSFRIQEISSNEPTLIINPTKEYISALLFSDNSLIAGFGDGSIRFFDMEKFKEISCYKDSHEGTITNLSFLSSNKLLSISNDKFIKLWGINDQKIIELLQTGEGHTMGVKDVIIENNTAISVSSDSKICKWQLPELELIENYSTHKYSVNSITISNNGEYIATSSNDKRVVLHDKDLIPKLTYQGHNDSVICSVFSNNDKWLFTGSKSGEIIIFDVAKEKVYNTLDIHTDAILKMKFSDDNQFLAVISSDNNISLYSYSESEDGSFSLKNIYFGFILGKPTDLYWLTTKNESPTSKFLISTNLGSLLEFSITRISNSQAELETLPKPDEKAVTRKTSKKKTLKKKTSKKKKVSKKKKSKQ